jgi:hypothetical protein
MNGWRYAYKKSPDENSELINDALSEGVKVRSEYLTLMPATV